MKKSYKNLEYSQLQKLAGARYDPEYFRTLKEVLPGNRITPLSLHSKKYKRYH